MKEIFDKKGKSRFDPTGIIIAVMVMVAVVIAFFLLRAENDNPIKIGAILPLTGSGSYIGEQVRDGMLLAILEINYWGGINGREIELIIEDSQSEPEEGKRLFGQIEKSRHPLLYVSTLSSVSTAVSPLAEESEVVLMALVSTAPKITEQKEWTFRYYPMADMEVLPILWILEDLNIKKLGIHYLNDEFGRSVSELVKKEFKKTGGTVISLPFETDLKQEHKGHVEHWKNIEAIFVVGFPEHFRIILKILREENYSGHILGSSDAAVPSVLRLPEADGMYLAAPVIYNPRFIFAKEVKDKYETLYDKPLDHVAANSYDIVKILAGLLEDEELSRENLKNLLEEGFIYDGILGSIDVRGGERDASFPLYPAQIVEGKINYLK